MLAKFSNFNTKLIIMDKIASIRREYSSRSLSEHEVNKDPVKQFMQWFEEALHAEVLEPNAMHLSTIGLDERPKGRIVLLKGVEEGCFVFFTNYLSHKGKEIEKTPWVSLTFFWAELERQVRIEGKVSKLPGAASDEYFHSRPRGSQIGAWVSMQSEEIPGRDFLEKRLAEVEKQYEGVEIIPRPPHWGGYMVEPGYFEFWQGRPNRLHDRICYRLEDNGLWRIARLSP